MEWSTWRNFRLPGHQNRYQFRLHAIRSLVFATGELEVVLGLEAHCGFRY